MVTEPACLGVEQSISGRRWLQRPVLPRQVDALTQQLGLNEALARVLAGRGVDIESAESFLQPQLRTLMPDPSVLKDMDRAVDRLVHALGAQEKILVFGDYDVDGGASTAMMVGMLRSLGATVTYHIPDRQVEGYGPSPGAMQRFAQDGISLILTLDCGTAAHDAMATARTHGLDVIVLDHHKAPAELPDAFAIVNPNRLDEAPGPLGTLAAVGVIFLTIVALRRALRDQNRNTGLDPLSLLDLAALGTVCDMVPLTGLNRALVVQGLKIMSHRHNAGLAALADVSKAHGTPSTYHLGFLLGPRINAGGRIGDAGLGTKLLLAQDREEAAPIAAQLDALNKERQAVEQMVLDAALVQAEAQEDAPVLLTHGPDWHPGVAGIVAGRLKEQFHRPALVLAQEGAQATGSGRSIPGVDLGAAIIDAADQGLLIKGGGHAMAAGLTIAMDALPDFSTFLLDRLAPAVTKARAQAALLLDGVLAASACTLETADSVAAGGPYGMGHPGPRFALRDCRITDTRLVGNDHVKLSCGTGAQRFDAIAFRTASTDLGQTLLQGRDKIFHLAGQIRANEFGGRRTAQLQVEDAAPAGP